MENRHHADKNLSTGSLAGLPRIQDGLDFVKRWEANVLLNGLASGERAHRILLEVVRRVAIDRPHDMQIALDRLNELQSFLNAMDHPVNGTLAIKPADLVLVFEHAKHAVLYAEPWHGPSRWRGSLHGFSKDGKRRATAIAHVSVQHSGG